jgi:hypothetical protein
MPHPLFSLTFVARAADDGLRGQRLGGRILGRKLRLRYPVFLPAGGTREKEDCRAWPTQSGAAVAAAVHSPARQRWARRLQSRGRALHRDAVPAGSRRSSRSRDLRISFGSGGSIPEGCQKGGEQGASSNAGTPARGARGVLPFLSGGLRFASTSGYLLAILRIARLCRAGIAADGRPFKASAMSLGFEAPRLGRPGLLTFAPFGACRTKLGTRGEGLVSRPSWIDGCHGWLAQPCFSTAGQASSGTQARDEGRGRTAHAIKASATASSICNFQFTIFNLQSLAYRSTPKKKLNICVRSCGSFDTGKAKSKASGAGPIAGIRMRKPKPGATR